MAHRCTDSDHPTGVVDTQLHEVWRHVHREGTTGTIGWRAMRGRGGQARTMVAGHLPSVRSRWLTRWRLRSAQGHPVGRPHPPRPRRRPHHPARCTNRPPGPGTTPVLDREATAISTERKKRGRHSLLSIGAFADRGIVLQIELKPQFSRRRLVPGTTSEANRWWTRPTSFYR